MDEYDFSSWYRIVVAREAHLASPSDMVGSVLCGDQTRNPGGAVRAVYIPGEMVVTSVCRLCAALSTGTTSAAGGDGAVQPGPNRPILTL